MSATILAPAAEAGFDWPALYATAQGTSPIAGADAESRESNQFTARHMFIDAAATLSKLREQGNRPLSVALYGDVVRFPSNSSIELAGTALLVAARRVEVEDGARIGLKPEGSRSPLIGIWTSDLAGSLRLAGGESTLELGPLSSKGVIVNLKNGKLVRNAVDHLQQPMGAERSELQRSLGSILQYATALYSDHADTAAAMLRWVEMASAGLAELEPLHKLSASLLLMLKAGGNGSPFVPYLSSALYRDLFASFAAAAEAYNEQFERFVDRGLTLGDRKSAARLMLANHQDATQFGDELIAQTRANLDAALAAVEAARLGMQHQHDSVERAKVDFNAGLREFKHDQTVQAAFQIIGLVMDMASAYASLAVGLIGTPALPQLRKLGDAAVLDLVKELEGAVKAASAGVKAAQGIQQAAGNVKGSTGAKDPVKPFEDPLADSDGLSDTAAWTRFQVEADAALAPAIRAGVRGASGYQAQLDILAVYGRTLAENQLAAIQVSQQLALLLAQSQASQIQRDRLLAALDEINKDEQKAADAMQYFQDRQLDMKRSLYLAVQNYVSAYRYWALRDSSVKPSMSRSMAELREDLARVQNDYNRALESFQPKPQAVTRLQWMVAEPEIIQGLKTTGVAGFAISSDDPLFAGLGRVRANTVRVFLEGAKPAPKRPIHVVLRNSGHYEDRLAGKDLRFAAAPLQLAFEYYPGDPPVITVDGTAADELRFAFFVPAPFSQWTLTIPQTRNRGLDLSGLTRITLEFSGSAIAEN